jgi:TonB family protein
MTATACIPKRYSIIFAATRKVGLDEAAIEAVKQWRFKPFIGSDGLPERIEGLVTIVFN